MAGSVRLRDVADYPLRRFVDHDMYMRYRGDGPGHRRYPKGNLQHAARSSGAASTQAAEDPTAAECRRARAAMKNAGRNAEDVDADEQVDFGYVLSSDDDSDDEPVPNPEDEDGSAEDVEMRLYEETEDDDGEAGDAAMLDDELEYASAGFSL